jgi:hypothetical protein
MIMLIYGRHRICLSQYGFKISNIISVGEGNKANPARLYIVMERQ